MIARFPANAPTPIPADVKFELCADSKRRGSKLYVGGSASKRRKAEKGGRAWGANEARAMHGQLAASIDLKRARSDKRRADRATARAAARAARSA